MTRLDGMRADQEKRGGRRLGKHKYGRREHACVLLFTNILEPGKSP